MNVCPAKTWKDGHQQEQVNVREKRRDRFKGRVGIGRESDAQPERARLFEVARGLANLHVNGAAVGACALKGFEILARVGDHEVCSRRTERL